MLKSYLADIKVYCAYSESQGSEVMNDDIYDRLLPSVAWRFGLDAGSDAPLCSLSGSAIGKPARRGTRRKAYTGIFYLIFNLLNSCDSLVTFDFLNHRSFVLGMLVRKLGLCYLSLQNSRDTGLFIFRTSILGPLARTFGLLYLSSSLVQFSTVILQQISPQVLSV
jgi:hypothetical protein